MMPSPGDWMVYGYVALTLGGLIARPLAARFPNQRWLSVIAIVCQTLGPHWGVIASLRAGAHVAGHVLDADSSPDVSGPANPPTPPAAGQ